MKGKLLTMLRFWQIEFMKWFFVILAIILTPTFVLYMDGQLFSRDPAMMTTREFEPKTVHPGTIIQFQVVNTKIFALTKSGDLWSLDLNNTKHTWHPVSLGAPQDD